MYNHEPPDYDCPLCMTVRGEDQPDPWTKASDVFYRDDRAVAWINQRWWGSIEGNAIVIPAVHYENIFDLPDDAAAAIHNLSRRIAIAMMETYGCTGISTRQHNGPDGNQEVWHYHVHVFPRWRDDRLYERNADFRWATPDERAPYAEKLRNCLRSKTANRF